MNNLDWKTFKQQPPMCNGHYFWGPYGGRCRQVRLYIDVWSYPAHSKWENLKLLHWVSVRQSESATDDESLQAPMFSNASVDIGILLTKQVNRFDNVFLKGYFLVITYGVLITIILSK